jgi:hypothetical protein
MASLLGVGKVAFFLTLCIFHSIFFGFPAFERYLDASISVEEWIEPSATAALPAPAVTLCPFEKYFSGWKNTSEINLLDNYEAFCPGANRPEDFVTCVEQKTFKASLKTSAALASGSLTPLSVSLGAATPSTTPGAWAPTFRMSLSPSTSTQTFSIPSMSTSPISC